MRTGLARTLTRTECYIPDVGASLAIELPVSVSMMITHENSTSHGSAEGTKGHVDTIRLLVVLLT